MVIPDLNLLVYSYNRAAPGHARARAWWETLLSDDEPVGMPWVCVLGFIRLMTHAAVLKEPWGVNDCIERVEEWFDAPNVVALEPGPRHLTILAGLVRHVGVGGNLVTDAHLAALAIEHNAVLHTNDADFARFPGVSFFSPVTD